MNNKNHACTSESKLPEIYRSSTKNVEQHIKALKDWKLQFLQMSAGQFKGEIICFELEGLKVIRERISQSVLKKGELENASISFNIPLSLPSSPLICQGKTYPTPGILAVRGGELPEIKVPAGLELLCLNVDAHYLAGLLDGPNADIDRSLSKPCYIPATIGQRGLARLFELSCRSLTSHVFPAVRRELRDALLNQLLDELERGVAEKVAPSARKRVVDRAREVIAAHDSEPVSILSLCHQIGVSRRKLQYCFQECLGISPVTYIRLFRLNAVHRSLLHGDDATQIQNEAARWGFLHLGRFSVEYRRLFGERPSETLHRSQKNRADSG
ncbi:helix-turn-helix domain-containing protein [Halomonas sp. WWR20]